MSKAIIDLKAYRHNLQVVRNLVGTKTKIIAVVKANAYAHGIVPISRTAERFGVDMLAVANIEEGVILREHGIRIPILVLLQPDEEEIPSLFEYKLTPLVSELELARKLSEHATRYHVTLPIHCKIDTGMGRQGFNLDTAVSELKTLVRLPHLDLQGIATHFPCADQENDSFTLNQIRIFSKLLTELDQQGIPFEFAHCANSPALINYPKSYFDAVRPGLMTYGIWPTHQIPKDCPLIPILRWESRVTQVRTLPAGATIGYNRTFVTPHEMTVAIVPVGYADGYRLQLSNCGEVLIHGTRCPVRGNVSMDQIVVEIRTEKPVKAGDVVTLIGKDGDDEITVHELAQRAGTISYEFLTGIGQRVKRIYINEEETEPVK